MAAFWARSPANRGAWLCVAAALLLMAFTLPSRAQDPIVVAIDEAKVISLPPPAKTVVIGNPLIADVSIIPIGSHKDLYVVTGKGYGATNLIAVDDGGVELTRKLIEVRGPLDPTIVVYRGVTHQTYSCTPECSRRIMLGDTGQDYFDEKTTVDKDYYAKTIDQTVTRNAQALGAAMSGH
jgi:Flp pilus assembly secretin CpaC